MPKKYKDKKNQKFESELTAQELNKVGDVQDYVDDEIDLQWENGSVLIDECVIKFECEPVTHNPTGIPENKRLIMTNLLLSRYWDADWRNNLAVNGQRRFTPIKKL